MYWMNPGYLMMEMTTTEYKEIVQEEKPKSWLKSVSAFANTEGGSLVFGISDQRHESKGIHDIQQKKTRITELLKRHIEPIPYYTLCTQNICGNQCIVLCVEKMHHKPCYYVQERTREAYIRRGDRSELVSAMELNRMILEGMHLSFDMMPTQYTLSQASFHYLSTVYERERGYPLDLSKELSSIGLVDFNGYLTYAGALLSDQGMIPQSKIVCTKWNGLSKSNPRYDVYEDKTFEKDSLLYLLERAEKFISFYNRHTWRIEGMKRVERSAYPIDAVREALVNAVIHRDYQIYGSEIHVDIFDDRIEIVSPGGMISGGKIQFQNWREIPSMRRNPVLSECFARLNYMERKGSGLLRILDAYRNTDKTVKFYSEDYFFKCVMPDLLYQKQWEEKAYTVQESSVLYGSLCPANRFAMKLSSKTLKDWQKEALSLLYMHYAVQTFTICDVMQLLDYNKKQASILLYHAIQSGLIQSPQTNTYQFVSELQFH